MKTSQDFHIEIIWEILFEYKIESEITDTAWDDLCIHKRDKYVSWEQNQSAVWGEC